MIPFIHLPWCAIGLDDRFLETNRFQALGPHPEEQAFAPEGEGLRLEGWQLAPCSAAILRDASLGAMLLWMRTGEKPTLKMIPAVA
jgi:hypothetical protein